LYLDFLLRRGRPSVWLFVCFLYYVDGHNHYQAIYVERQLL
jgi:hypothetical protein